MPTANPLLKKHCKPIPEGTRALTPARIKKLLPLTPGWQIISGKLTRTFTFKNYYESLAFVNATAFITHAQDHHPDIALGYNTVTLAYNTHTVNGLSENDFICAAKMNTL